MSHIRSRTLSSTERTGAVAANPAGRSTQTATYLMIGALAAVVVAGGCARSVDGGARGTQTAPAPPVAGTSTQQLATPSPSMTCHRPQVSGPVTPMYIACGPVSPPPALSPTTPATSTVPTVPKAPQGQITPSTTPTTPTTPAAGGPVDPATLQIAPNTYAWLTPSGNIYCLLDGGSVFCQAKSHDFSYLGTHCGQTSADGVEIKPGFLVEVDCFGDAPQNPVGTLGYGSTVTVSSLTCDSESSGMKCVDADHGDGFVVNKSSITLLPHGDHPLPLSDGSPNSSGSSSSSSTTAGTIAPFVGTWSGHGRMLTVSARGEVSITYRLYAWCGPTVPWPCDAKRGDSIVPGGTLSATVNKVAGLDLYGTVTSSSTADYVRGSAFGLHLTGGVITTSLGGFCADGVSSPSCGA